jgi:hypothetical protein
MECLGLHNKPKAEVHPEHPLTDPKEKEQELLLFMGEVQVLRQQIHFGHMEPVGEEE